MAAATPEPMTHSKQQRRRQTRGAGPLSTLAEVLLLIAITAVSTTLLVSIVLPNRLPACSGASSAAGGT